MVDSIKDFLITHKFDGFDIDWEYPSLRGGSMADKINYITFLKELRAAFDGTNFLMTAAVGAPRSFLDSSYDAKSMSM